MKTLQLLTVLSSLLPASAAASSWPGEIFDGAAPQVLAEVAAHQDLVQEAETHLYECPSGKIHDACLQGQYNFVLDYVYAFYDDHDSQQNIAYLLAGDDARGGPDDSGEPGITPDPMRGCAWRIAIIGVASGGFDNTDLGNYKSDCLNLSAEEQSLANTIAYSQIVPVIGSHLARHDRPFDIFTGN